MSLGVMQHVAGVVYELLHVKDICGYREAGVALGYDLEAVLIVPQSYITLRTEVIDDLELNSLLDAVKMAFTMVHGEDIVTKLPIEAFAGDLFAELKFVHQQIMDEMTAQAAAGETQPA